MSVTDDIGQTPGSFEHYLVFQKIGLNPHRGFLLPYTRNIPVKGRLNKSKKPIWMTNKALRAVRQRRRVYRKYKDTSHPAYIKAAKSAHKLADQAKRNFEEQLARKMKDDRKSFFCLR